MFILLICWIVRWIFFNVLFVFCVWLIVLVVVFLLWFMVIVIVLVLDCSFLIMLWIFVVDCWVCCVRVWILLVIIVKLWLDLLVCVVLIVVLSVSRLVWFVMLLIIFSMVLMFVVVFFSIFILFIVVLIVVERVLMVFVVLVIIFVFVVVVLLVIFVVEVVFCVLLVIFEDVVVILCMVVVNCFNLWSWECMVFVDCCSVIDVDFELCKILVLIVLDWINCFCSVLVKVLKLIVSLVNFLLVLVFKCWVKLFLLEVMFWIVLLRVLRGFISIWMINSRINMLIIRVIIVKMSVFFCNLFSVV